MKKTIEQWAAEKKIPAWKVSVARAFERWPVGYEVTEEQFEESLRLSLGCVLR